MLLRSLGLDGVESRSQLRRSGNSLSGVASNDRSRDITHVTPHLPALELADIAEVAESRFVTAVAVAVAHLQ